MAAAMGRVGFIAMEGPSYQLWRRALPGCLGFLEASPIWYGVDELMMLPLPQLDPASEEPLYRQLHGFIKHEIKQGRLAKGTRIPPTRELAGQLGLNRTTVAAAYELLENEGLIRGHVGRGSFVAASGESGGMEPLRWEERLAPLPETESFTPLPNGAKEVASFVSSRPSELQFPLQEFQTTCEEVLASREASRVLQLARPWGMARSAIG